MAPGNAGGYLPGDPRYGLSGEAIAESQESKASRKPARKRRR